MVADTKGVIRVRKLIMDKTMHWPKEKREKRTNNDL